MTGPESRSQPRSWGVARAILLVLALGLGVHLLLPRIATVEASFAVVRTMAWWAVALAAVAQALSYAGNGYTTQATIRPFGVRLPLALCSMAVMSAYTIYLFGGQIASAAAIYRWTHRAGAPYKAALVAGFAPAAINLVTIGAVGGFGVVYLLAVHELPAALMAVFVATLALIGGISVVAVWGWWQRTHLVALVDRGADRVDRILRRPSRHAAIEQGIAEVYEALDLLRAGGWRGPLLGDFANVGFDIVALYLVFVATGYAPSPGVVLAGYGLPLLAGKLSSLPGGLSAVEASMVALYEALGAPSAVAVVVIIAYRLISFWIPVLVGLLAFPFLEHWTSRIRSSPA